MSAMDVAEANGAAIGSQDWIDALVADGYTQHGSETPQNAPDTGPVVATRPVAPVPDTGPVPAQPPILPTMIPPTFTLIKSIADRIRDAVTTAAADPVAAVGAVAGRMKDAVVGTVQAALPTITDLALGLARTAGASLDFLADNLTDAAEFGASIAQGIAAPFDLLLNAGGSMLWDGLAHLLRLLASAVEFAIGDVFMGVQLERLI